MIEGAVPDTLAEIVQNTASAPPRLRLLRRGGPKTPPRADADDEKTRTRRRGRRPGRQRSESEATRATPRATAVEAARHGTAWGGHPLARAVERGWTASAVERLAVLLRARDVPVGVVTDGRWWALVWAPRGKPVGAAVWDASLLSEEPPPFGRLSRCSPGRFLAVPPRTASRPAPAKSAERQEEVTEPLGRQVREAVEMLISASTTSTASPTARYWLVWRRRPLRRRSHGHDAGRVPAVRRGTPPAAQRRRPATSRLHRRPPRRTAGAAGSLGAASSSAPPPGTGCSP